MDSVTEQFVTYPKPMENFDINAVKQCLYQNKYVFTNKTTLKYGSMVHKWEFGDGATMNAPNASHFYLKDTTYLVKLSNISNFGCTDTITKIVEVMSMPKVNFSINDVGQCFKTQNFQFQDLTKLKKGTLSTFWDFGDSSVSSVANTSHSFTRIGNYKIKMFSTSDFGCKDSTYKQVWVNPNSNPSFQINDTGQCEPNPLFVFQSTSNIIKGSIVKFVYDLGRYDIRNGFKQSKKYNYTGTETITIYTSSDSGCMDSAKRKIQIYQKPKAKMLINDSAQCVRQNDYLFTNVSADGFRLKNTYWNIDNNNFTDPILVNYKFKDTGFKKIVLVQSNVFDCFDTLYKFVYVKPMPDPAFAKLKTYYCQGNPFETIIPNTSGGVFEGHNMQGDFYVPSVLWGDTVKYKITVNGCTDSSIQYTQVFPKPSVNLGNDTTICKNEILEFEVKSWNSTYLWRDGITTPIRRINKEGTYIVDVTNICGVISDTIRVGYLDEDCHIVVPTAFTPNGDGKNDFYKPVTTDVTWLKYQIINRWGEILFKGDLNSPGWDGNSNGEPAMNGAYILNYQYQYRSAYRDVVENKSLVFYLLR
jgi:gliding motility-associated-like protein